MENIQITSLAIPPQQVHKAVRNYLINELDISKQKIDDMVKELVEKEVRRILENHILNSRFLESLIEQAIFGMIKKGVSDGVWYDEKRLPFTQFVKQQVAKTIRDQVLEKFDVHVEEKSK